MEYQRSLCFDTPYIVNLISAMRKINAKISGLYLMIITYVKNGRDQFEVPMVFENNKFIIEYGYTDDLIRRFKEPRDSIEKLKFISIWVFQYYILILYKTHHSSSNHDLRKVAGYI